MKKKIYTMTSVVAFSFFSVVSFSQEKDKLIKSRENNTNGTPSFITFNEKSSYRSSDFQKVFKEQLELEPNQSFSKIKTDSDKLGFIHEKFQLYQSGIKVEFATYSIHSKNGEVTAISGEFYKTNNTNTTPALTPAAALQKAITHIDAEEFLWQNVQEAKAINYSKPQGELVLLPIDGNVKLAYKFDIYATNPVSRGDVYVDAQNGKVLFYNTTIKHLGEHSHCKSSHNTGNTPFTPFKKTSILATGNAATRYSGTQTIETSLNGSSYILYGTSRGNGVQTYNMNKGTNYSAAVNFTDNDNNWTAAEYNNSNKDNAALDAHWGAEKTYDYWQTVHGRNSFNGSGAKINSYVHYANAYDNAYWDGSRMTYGDGSGVYFDALTSLDVAAHEIGHAICTYTANLAYQKESGAMNEGFSDIWAACVEYYAAPSKQIWLIGEDIEMRSGHVALRSMSNPNAEGQPDTYGGSYWINPNCTPTSNNDYCGVHTNSGVLNFWFYLLSVGGSGTNDLGNAYSVSGITIDKAAKIAFRLESQYLSSSSTFANARTGAIQAATDLYGEDSPEVIATTNAWYAVGVGAQYSGGGSTTPSSYCASKGNSVSDEYIGNVQMGSINNSSTGNNGYTDFTNISTSVSKGESVTITITPVWTGTSYNEGYAVWIDYNNDNDFDDSGELVWSKTASKTTPVSGTFTIPTSATSGATRMRVSMKYNGVPSSCETFSYGEVEDYTVTIGSSAADTTAPTAPTSLTASGTTQTSTTLSWNASSDNVGVIGYDVYRSSTLIGSTTSTSANVTGLTAATTYSFTVRAKDAAGNVSSASNSVAVTTLSASTPPASYCTSKGNNATYEWIDYVALNGMTNSTGNNGGYADFTSMTASLPYGSNTIVFSAGFRSSSYTEYWSVWIDYNQNGTFESTEKVVGGSSSSSGNLSGTFTVPTTALAGATRMRVQMKYNATSTACETFSYGEVEDYTVNIGASAVASFAFTGNEELSNETNVFEFNLYPNPVSSVLNIIMADDRNVDFAIHNTLGQTLKSGKLSKEINVSDLADGVYILEIKDGQKVIAKKFVKK